MKSWQVQGKQGTERREKLAAEAELDPKTMLRPLKKLLVMSPHSTVCAWRIGMVSALPSHCPHAWTALAWHSLSNSRVCAALWGGGEGQVGCGSSGGKTEPLTVSLTLSACVWGLTLPIFNHRSVICCFLACQDSSSKLLTGECELSAKAEGNGKWEDFYGFTKLRPCIFLFLLKKARIEKKSSGNKC